MYTVTIGVLDDYSNEAFYSKDRNFSLEKQRVDLKFKNSSQLGKLMPLTTILFNIDKFKKKRSLRYKSDEKINKNRRNKSGALEEMRMHSFD